MTGAVTAVAGAIATLLARRTARKLLSTTTTTTYLVNQLKRETSQTPCLQPGQNEMTLLTANLKFLEHQLPQLCARLDAAGEPLQIFMELAYQLRIAATEAEVLQLSIEAARLAIKADRVIVVCFNSPGQGTVVEESVGAGWSSLLWSPLLDSRLILHQSKQPSQVQAIDDIYESDLSDLQIERLEQYAIKADLMVPIWISEQLFGYLIAHQCSRSRLWQPSELSLWKQLSLQIGLSLARINGSAIESAVFPDQQQALDLFSEIWSSPDEDRILDLMVQITRKHLETARAVIIRVESAGESGSIVAESVLPGFDTALEMQVDVAETWFMQDEVVKGQRWPPQVITEFNQTGAFRCQLWSDLGGGEGLRFCSHPDSRTPLWTFSDSPMLRPSQMEAERNRLSGSTHPAGRTCP